MTNDSDLSWIAACAAMELDLASKNLKKDFKYTEKLRDFIGTQVIKGDDNYSDHVDLEHGLTVWQCLHAFSEKPTSSHVSQYALDLKLLHLELQQVDALPNDRLEVLMNFACSLSQHSIAHFWENASYNPNKKYFAA